MVGKISIEDVDVGTRGTRRDVEVQDIGRWVQQDSFGSTNLAENIGHDLFHCVSASCTDSEE